MRANLSGWTAVDGQPIRRIAGGSGIRGRRSLYPPSSANGGSELGSQSPEAGGVKASLRVPRAQGLVGVGVGADAVVGPVTYPLPVGGGAGSLIDLSSVFTWRVIVFVAALVYITGAHVAIGRLRLRLPRV